MRAVVLVGGQGTRLRPLTYAIPKPLLPVAGRPMIARTIEWLGRYGVEEVVLSLGYQPDAFFDVLPSGSSDGVAISYAVEPTPLDTAGAIAFAAQSAGIAQERIVVVNGDVLTDLDLGGLLAFHLEAGGEASIALTPVEDPSAFGVVPTDERGCVQAFIEKPARELAPTNYINAGTYVLEPAALARIPAGRPVSIEREVFPQMVADRVLFALGDAAYWIDTGTPANYLAAQFDVIAGRRAHSSIPAASEVHPGVYVGERARIDGEVLAPSLVGARAVVASGAHVEQSVLGDDVRVGAGARVEGSVVLAGAVIGAGAVVSNSVVGEGAQVGATAHVGAQSIIGWNEHIEEGTTLDSARVPV